MLEHAWLWQVGDEMKDIRNSRLPPDNLWNSGIGCKGKFVD